MINDIVNDVVKFKSQQLKIDGFVPVRSSKQEQILWVLMLEESLRLTPTLQEEHQLAEIDCG